MGIRSIPADTLLFYTDFENHSPYIIVSNKRSEQVEPNEYMYFYTQFILSLADGGKYCMGYIFILEEKKREMGCSGPQVSWLIICLLDIHMEVGPWILAWLMVMACELGRSALDESPTVPDILWPFPQRAKSKSAPGEPTARWFCEGRRLCVMPWARRGWSPLRADKKGSFLFLFFF